MTLALHVDAGRVCIEAEDCREVSWPAANDCIDGLAIHVLVRGAEALKSATPDAYVPVAHGPLLGVPAPAANMAPEWGRILIARTLPRLRREGRASIPDSYLSHFVQHWRAPASQPLCCIDDKVSPLRQCLTTDVRLSWRQDQRLTNVPLSVGLFDGDVNVAPAWGREQSGTQMLSINILNALVPPCFDGLHSCDFDRGRASYVASSLYERFSETFLEDLDPRHDARLSVSMLRAWIYEQLHDLEDPAFETLLNSDWPMWFVKGQSLEV